MPENPNMLVGFIAGSNATSASYLDSKTKMNVLYDILRVSFPTFKFPNPVDFIMYIIFLLQAKINQNLSKDA